MGIQHFEKHSKMTHMAKKLKLLLSPVTETCQLRFMFPTFAIFEIYVELI